jgi:acyl carrier protein
MTNPDVYEMVKKIFVEYFELDESKVRPEATLFDDLGLDSLDMVDLAVEMQSRFGFSFDRIADEEKVRSIRTIQDFCGLVEEKIETLKIPIPKQ